MLIAGSIALSVNATGREQITTEETESISKTANISEDCVDYCGEVTQRSMNAVEARSSFTETLKNCSTINSADLNDVERIFNCNLSVASAEKILDQGTNQIYTRKLQ